MRLGDFDGARAVACVHNPSKIQLTAQKYGKPTPFIETVASSVRNFKVSSVFPIFVQYPLNVVIGIQCAIFVWF